MQDVNHANVEAEKLPKPEKIWRNRQRTQTPYKALVFVNCERSEDFFSGSLFFPERNYGKPYFNRHQLLVRNLSQNHPPYYSYNTIHMFGNLRNFSGKLFFKPIHKRTSLGVLQLKLFRTNIIVR